jgi:hypothetical protein
LYITNNIEAFNRKLMELANTFSHTRTLETDHNKSWFTNHALYLNKLFKELLSKQIVSLAYSVLEKQKIGSLIILDRYTEQPNCVYSCWFSTQIKVMKPGIQFLKVMMLM